MSVRMPVQHAQRRILLIVALLSPAVVIAGGLDDTFMPKAMIIALGVIAAATVPVLRGARRHFPPMPRSRFEYLALAFGAAVVLTSLTSDATALSLAGTFGRYTGALMYLIYLATMLLGARLFSDGWESVRLAAASVLGALLVGGYAVLQEIGLDPIPWDATFVDRVTATMGNPNFLSGFLGVAMPLAAMLVLTRKLRFVVLGVVAMVVALAGILVSRSEQGLIAAAAGGVVLALVYTRATWSPRRASVASWTLLSGSAVGAVLVGLGIFNVGPLSALASGLGQRVGFWQSGLRMFAAHPVLGVGFSRYGAYYREYKVIDPIIAADPGISSIASNPATTVDDPHNVVLAMLTGGGIVTALAFIALWGFVLWRLARWTRRVPEEGWLPVAGFGGALVAYVVVSMVSIDVPPIAFLGWLAGGVVLGHVAPSEVRAGASERGAVGRSRLAIGGAVGLLGAGLLWYYPLTGNLEAGSTYRLTQAEAPAQAVDHGITAVQRASWRNEYWFEFGRALTAAGDLENAANAFHRALEKDPRDFASAVTLGRILRERDEQAASLRWYERALELDPNSADFTVEVARQYLAAGGDARAQELARRALELDPDNEGAREILTIFG